MSIVAYFHEVLFHFFGEVVARKLLELFAPQQNVDLHSGLCAALQNRVEPVFGAQSDRTRRRHATAEVDAVVHVPKREEDGSGGGF